MSVNNESTKAIVKVPCPDCGELSPEPVERVAKHDVIPCSLCGGLIDLSAADCAEAVATARRLSP
jgi:endogenous inhibitor of DNA gyrase (YacG/DUF329 family)